MKAILLFTSGHIVANINRVPRVLLYCPSNYVAIFLLKTLHCNHCSCLERYSIIPARLLINPLINLCSKFYSLLVVIIRTGCRRTEIYVYIVA